MLTCGKNSSIPVPTNTPSTRFTMGPATEMSHFALRIEIALRGVVHQRNSAERQQDDGAHAHSIPQATMACASLVHHH